MAEATHRRHLCRASAEFSFGAELLLSVKLLYRSKPDLSGENEQPTGPRRFVADVGSVKTSTKAAGGRGHLPKNAWSACGLQTIIFTSFLTFHKCNKSLAGKVPQQIRLFQRQTQPCQAFSICKWFYFAKCESNPLRRVCNLCLVKTGLGKVVGCCKKFTCESAYKKHTHINFLFSAPLQIGHTIW